MDHDKVVHVTESLFFLRFTLLARGISALNDRKDKTVFILCHVAPSPLECAGVGGVPFALQLSPWTLDPASLWRVLAMTMGVLSQYHAPLRSIDLERRGEETCSSSTSTA